MLASMIRKLSLAIPLLLLLSSPVGAAVQRGPQSFPGRLQLGVHPLGFQVDTGLNGWYKFEFDFVGLLGHGGRTGVWLGGGLDYAVTRPLAHDVQPWLLVMLTFERMVRIPLVPLLKLGVGTDLFFGNNGLYTATFAFRAVVGMHYWLTRNLGLGLETGFTFGPAFNDLDPPARPVRVTGYATWDTVFGLRFAF
jgi:hypothetical protein